MYGIILLLPIAIANVQVTIGLGNEPREGLLLDLKQYNNSGQQPNANAGLGLPRVALTSASVFTVDDNTKKTSIQVLPSII